MISGEILNYYRQPGTMTSAGQHTAVLESLPGGVEELAAVVQGLMLHEHWAPAYGQTLSDERRGQAHIRAASDVLNEVLNNDVQHLATSRPLERRVVGNCRSISVMMVTFLRAKGIPARARCGFGTYFNPGTFEDHWVCEYWNREQERWILVDAQIDDFQRGRLAIDFDVLDVPRDRFIIAGDGWMMCRTCAADPQAFGIADMRGLWFVAGNVFRDLASLNSMEMLPWDVWGGMPEPDTAPDAVQVDLIDRIATLTREADRHFAALQDLYTDERLAVPEEVFNALRDRLESI